jgi:hypothetical protein
MSTFTRLLAARIKGYVRLRRSLGYAFQSQALTLTAFGASSTKPHTPDR